MLRLWWGTAELFSEQLSSHHLPPSRRKISFPWRGHSSDSQGRSSWGCVCYLYWLLFLKGCRGTGPCFSNIRDSGGAWEGWIMSLEMEKQSHFNCQAPKLVGLRIFSSHPWGDLCLTKEPLVKFGFALLQFQVSLDCPHLEDRELLPTEGDHFQLFFLLGYKGWLHLVHFNEQPLFSHLLSGTFCAKLQPNEKGKKAPLKWRSRTRRIQ